MKITINYIPSECEVLVLSDYLRINFTKEYIESLTSLPSLQSKRVLYWLGKLYNEFEGINIMTVQRTAEGVRAGLL